jgi:uncharacterized protein (TIGR02246 family)
VSIEDKLAIHEVIAQYAHTWEAKDAEGFASLFTEDAVWESFAPGDTQPRFRAESRASIRAWATQSHHERPQGRYVRHHQSSTWFEALTTEAARTQTIGLVTMRDATDAAPRLTHSGVYHDQWRKTPEGWRFVRRTFHWDM